jgi:hypothetical protein
MRDIKKVWVLFLLICLSVFIPLHIYGTGTVGADFLRMEPPARTASMSNVFAGISDDVNSIIYNPAGLACVTVTTAAFTHFSSFGDTNCEYLCGAFPVSKELGTIGAGVMVDYTFDFPYYDEYGDQKGSVDNSDMVFTGTYAYPLYNWMSLGANLKYFHSTLYKYSKNGFAADAGVRVRLGKDPDTYAGFVVQNIGAQSAYISDVDQMPVNLKAGMGMKVNMNSLAQVTLGIDINRLISKDEMPTLDIGADALIFDVLSVRAGYGFRHDTGGLTMGIGITLDKVKFSYSYQPFDMLGTAHRISLDVALYEEKPGQNQ